MDDSDRVTSVSVGEALRDVLGTMPWLQLIAWAVAVAVQPLAYLLFAGYRTRYQRLVMDGESALPPFGWRNPLKDAAIPFVANIITRILSVPVALLAYWVLIRLLGLPYDRRIFFLLLAIPMAAFTETAIVTMILPPGPGIRRFRRVLAAVGAQPLAFGVAATAAGVTAVVASLGTLAAGQFAKPAWVGGALLYIPSLGQPRAAGAYLAILAGTTFMYLLLDVVAGHLFAQFARGPLNAIEASAAESVTVEA